MAYSDKKRIEIMASSFMDEPNKVVTFDRWEALKEWILQYKTSHEHNQKTDAFTDEFDRYCIAISCDEILEKMAEIDKKF